MKEENAKLIYYKWRRSEGHSLPMTMEGLDRADERFKGFKAGYAAGVRTAIDLLNKEHSLNKKQHSFFFKAASLLKNLLS